MVQHLAVCPHDECLIVSSERYDELVLVVTGATSAEAAQKALAMGPEAWAKVRQDKPKPTHPAMLDAIERYAVRLRRLQACPDGLM